MSRLLVFIIFNVYNLYIINRFSPILHKYGCYTTIQREKRIKMLFVLLGNISNEIFTHFGISKIATYVLVIYMKQ